MSNVPQTELVKLTQQDDVATVTIDRQKALNAINPQVLDELEQIFTHLAQESQLKAVVLIGAGDKAFVAGADIAAMSDMSPQQAQAFSAKGHRVFELIEQCPVPVIAAVNGFALGGGCELAMACDIIYAAPAAKFGQPEVKLGLIPGFGGCVRLPRRVSPGVAAQWIFTGEMVSAEQAEAVGLVTKVSDDVLAVAHKTAQTIARQAPLAVRAAKRAMQQGLAANPAVAASIEQNQFAQLFANGDVAEGTKAFMEKREPNFKGFGA